jgi:peptidoglycan/LPS O-acetylase OafA/YrhL
MSLNPFRIITAPAQSIGPSPQRDTFTLMGMAALLIANSHLEALYPAAWMAADGLVGNLIFFVLAGYGVAVSQHAKPYGVGRFYLRRIGRLYPSLWLVVGAGWLFGIQQFPGLHLDLATRLIWPTDFGFIAQIIIFYPVAWWLARQSTRIRCVVLTTALVFWIGSIMAASLRMVPGTPISLGSLPSHFWWAFFFFGFVLGCNRGLTDSRGTSSVASVGLASLVFIFYVTLKFGYYRQWFAGTGIPGPVVAAGMQGLALVGVMATLDGLPYINSWLTQLGLRDAAVWIGRSSLQIYLCHLWFVHWLQPVPLIWPAKILVFFLTMLAASAAIRWLLDELTVMMVKLMARRRQLSPPA